MEMILWCPVAPSQPVEGWVAAFSYSWPNPLNPTTVSASFFSVRVKRHVFPARSMSIRKFFSSAAPVAQRSSLRRLLRSETRSRQEKS